MPMSDHDITEINRQLEGEHPVEVLRWVNGRFDHTEVTMATGFGAEGVCLIDMLTKVNKEIPIFYLDTDVLFPETYQLRDLLEKRYGIRFTRYATSVSWEEQAARHGERLWERNPDLCCTIRKVFPLREALHHRLAWITAVRRGQSPTRVQTKIVERDVVNGLLKINPIARWSKHDVWQYIRDHAIPYNPMHDRGYPSIGCIYCTTSVLPGEDERAGRWRGFQKTECGLHQRREEGTLCSPAAAPRDQEKS